MAKKKKKWIKKAIKKPGALTEAAESKNMSIEEYCRNPRTLKAKKRCALWRTLRKMAKS